MDELRRVSIELYEHARLHAAARGIILADTKFEFGSSPGAEVVLGDEVLTPDSSRSGRPTTTSRVAVRRPSTSSTCATGSTSRAGTIPRRRPASPTT